MPTETQTNCYLWLAIHQKAYMRRGSCPVIVIFVHRRFARTQNHTVFGCEIRLRGVRFVLFFHFHVYLFCAIKANDRCALLIDRYCYVRCKCEIIRPFWMATNCFGFFRSFLFVSATGLGVFFGLQENVNWPVGLREMGCHWPEHQMRIEWMRKWIWEIENGKKWSGYWFWLWKKSSQFRCASETRNELHTHTRDPIHCCMRASSTPKKYRISICRQRK